MNSTYKLLIKQINDGKNLEEGIPMLFGKLSDSYQQYALYQLCLHYYDLATVVNENEQGGRDAQELVKSLQVIFKEVLEGKQLMQKQSELVEQLDAIRNTIIDKMDVLTMYTDKLQVYEYILNRKELEYAEQYEEINEEQFVQSAIQYIFGSKDNYMINEAIKQVISQLPVRMTKNKYFDVLRESLASFKGGNMDSLDTYLYMIKTCAMLYHSKGEESHYTNLREVVEELQTAEYKTLSKAKYLDLCELLVDTASYITEVSDLLMVLQQVVNNLYVYVLTKPYAEQVENQAACFGMLRLSYEAIEEDMTDLTEDRYIELVAQIEGKQEELFEECQILLAGFTTVCDGYTEAVEAVNETKLAATLQLCQQLSDQSAFIDFRKAVDMREVDEVVLASVAKQLEEEVKEVFKNNQQCVNRAIMANTLDKLPVFFNNTEEVISYITNAVELCSNKEEKTASMRLILDMIEENTAWSNR